MTEWWTYRLSDFLLFAPETYGRLFALANADVWPAQAVTLALGGAIPVLLWRCGAGGARAAALILAAAWLFVAWTFHWNRYATINWAAPWFAAAFALQAALLVAAAFIPGASKVGAGRGWPARIGLALYLFALAVHPLTGPIFAGRPWAQVELFAIAPDPTAVATLGFVLMAARGRWPLLVIPLLWCLVSALTLWTMGTAEAGVVAAAAVMAGIAAVPAARHG